VVDPGAVAFATVANIVALALPGLLWLFLFLLAWDHTQVAQVTGFGRFTVWMLLGGAFVGSLANLPFFSWDGDILAINLGGGLIPVGLSLFLLRNKLFQNALRNFLLFLGVFAFQSLLTFVAVLAGPVSATGFASGLPLYLALGALVVPPAALIVHGYPNRATLKVGVGLALADIALAISFLTTATNPAFGIYSEFPYYLIAPAVVGVLAVPLLRYLLARPLEESFALAYSTSTLGVLIGADLLRQPPLYGFGPAIFSVGGAGLGDLLYMSGLLALFVAFLMTRWGAFHLPIPRSERSPTGPASDRVLLQQGGEAIRAQRFVETVARADEAVGASVQRTQQLIGRPPESMDPVRWKGIPAAAWLVADASNLKKSAGAPRPEEAPRAITTAAFVTGYLTTLRRQAFASTAARAGAFLVDLLVLALATVLVTLLVIQWLPGTDTRVLSTPLFNAVVIGATSYGLAYFVACEWLRGETLGKRLFRQRVVDSRLGPPTLLQAFQRNVTNVIALLAFGTGVPVATLILARPGPAESAVPLFGAITAVLIVVGTLFVIAIPGLFAALACHADSERRRLGDRWAGTRVIQQRPGATRPAGAGPHPVPAAGPYG
jgi:uncharacterized membrane protein/uncharacterized RDD family membrane protein YckC